MQLRWADAAVVDLERIADYLFSNAPDRAPDLARSIYEVPEKLLSFPHRGRPGKKAGTRELVLSPLPWILVYTVRDDVVQVVRILHGAQRWP
ncbi:MAG: type II toxin-antitoxin system RelE/ParE family toxin [Acidobacteriota bacterium]|nr:type II toxin-antitoxin system RelE/ParE family toxin [Acidobacteriota bacterium]